MLKKNAVLSEPLLHNKTLSKLVIVLSLVSLALAFALLLSLYIIYGVNYNNLHHYTYGLPQKISSSQKSSNVPGYNTKSASASSVQKTSNNQTSLSFNPTMLQLKTGETLPLNLAIDTGNNDVLAVEFSLKYDPSKLELVSISPSDFFSKSTVFSNKIDGLKGSLNYALGSLSAKTGKGNLINIMVKAKSATGSTQITFSGETKVAGKGGTGNLLKAQSPANVEIK